MEEVKEFLGRLRGDFGQLRFREGRRFAFRPPRTIILAQAEEPREAAGEELAQAGRSGGRTETVGETARREAVAQYKMSALHEVGHALLEHRFYTTDPERLRMESEAWEKAKELCTQYGVEYDAEYAEGELDSYREWLHRRSRCPECGLTRYQTRDGEYHCPGCG